MKVTICSGIMFFYWKFSPTFILPALQQCHVLFFSPGLSFQLLSI